MKRKITLYLLLSLIIFTSCKDEGGQETSKGDISELAMPSLSRLGINKMVKSYKVYTQTFSFQQGTDKNGNKSFSGLSYKDIYENAYGSMNLKLNPLEIRITFREDLNIMNDYYQNFKFKYEGGPVVEMENIASHADGEYDSKGKIVFNYDDNDYLLSVVETDVWDDKTEVYKTVMEWEAAQSTMGKRLKAIYKYRNGELFDQLTFNYYSRARINKEGITPYFLTPYIMCMDFYMINTALAHYGFWGRPSSELPSSFRWGKGGDAEKLRTIHFTVDNSDNIIGIKYDGYSQLSEEFSYY